MASWRDSVSERAQQDLDDLVDAAVDFALSRIAVAGEFLPFAFAVSIDGQRQAIQPNYPRGAQLEIADQIAAQWRAVGELKDTLRAVAVAVNVTLPETNRDGIEVNVEHREGVAIGLVFPYLLGGDGNYQLQPPSAHSEEPHLWI